MTTSGTIVRYYFIDVDVVCYHHSHPYFMLYRLGTPTSYSLQVDMDTVTDFEIFDGKVFFCGKRNVSVGGNACFGYFDVTALYSSLSNPVYYFQMPLMEIATALEVGNFANRKHVVTIGQGTKGEAMVLDAIEEPTYWSMNYCNLCTDTFQLSDIAFTENNVVIAASRLIQSTDNIKTLWFGRLWSIKKPTISGSSLFPSNIDYLDFNHAYSTGTKIKITATEADKFVVAYHAGYYMVGTNPFYVSYYNNLNYINSYIIDEASDSYFRLGDIAYERHTRNVELRIYGCHSTATGNIYRSLIYEIPDIFSPPSSIPAHAYDGIYFESLDHTYFDEHMVASGYEQPGSYTTPYYLKYKSGYFDGNCLNRKENSYRIIHYETKKDNFYFIQTQIPQLPVEETREKKEMNLIYKCYSYDEKEQ